VTFLCGFESIPSMNRISSFDSTPAHGVRTLPFILVPAGKPMTCSHVDRIHNVQPSSSGCDDCVLVRDTWLQLRMCMECGYVGCCDMSKNKHAIGHFRATQHPIARSIEPDEEWGWCYIDQLWFEKLTLPA
jgi:monovalent cation:H+ antiporter-2, CPA2 family